MSCTHPQERVQGTGTWSSNAPAPFFAQAMYRPAKGGTLLLPVKVSGDQITVATLLTDDGGSARQDWATIVPLDSQ